MFGSSVLLIASGSVLMYLVLALFCTVISEGLTSFLATRAVNLERAVRQLLGSEDLTRKVLDHPLLQALGDPKRKDTRNLIIGWVFPDVESRTALDRLDTVRQIPRTPVGIFNKLIGVIFTALAASLGAPFWFDLLQRITKVRASGQQLVAGSPDAAKPAEGK